MEPVTSTTDHEATVKKKKALRSLYVIVFMQVMMHVASLQTEPVLIRELYNGDLAKTSSALANSQSLVGVLSLLLFTPGGKLSDALGRKPFLMLGPALNVLNGLAVAMYPKSLAVVVSARISRLTATTFSGSVMGTAMLMDTCSGTELASAQSSIGATTGLAVILTPILEELILKRTGNNLRFPYASLSVYAMLTLMFTLIYTPESLDKAKRTYLDCWSILKAANPFGFFCVFRSKNTALKQLTVITNLQTMLEGKNVSDLHQIWARNHLSMDFAAGRLYQTVYGTTCTLAGALLCPAMLKRMSAKTFTTVCNLGLALGFCMRSSESRWIYFSFAIPALPGVNAASATALKSLLKGHANAEGYGMGEFSAWQNNIRAVVSVISVLLYGNLYAWAKRKGSYPGIPWLSGALLGAALPQLLLLLMKTSDLEPSTKS